MSLDIDGKEAEKRMAKAIHYPDCWDTVAYPTLAIALWEMIDWDFANKKCSQCEKPQGLSTTTTNTPSNEKMEEKK